MRKARLGGMLAASFLLAAGLVPVLSSPAFAATTPVLNFAVNTSFNGTSTYQNKNTSLSTVAGLDEGSIFATFATTASGSKTIISASDAGDPSSNLTLTINGGELHLEVRDGGVDSTRMDWPTDYAAAGTLNDGVWHTVGVTVSAATGTRFYVDGYEVFTHTSTAFFDDVTDLDTLGIGRNVDSGGGQWYFNGQIGTVQVYDVALDPTEIATGAAEPTPLKSWPVAHTFSGGSPDYFTRTPHLADVGPLQAGAVEVEFKTTGTGRYVFLSASDVSEADTRVALGLDNGELFFEVKSSTLNDVLVAPGAWADGQWHVAAVTVGPRDTRLYVDGYLVALRLGTSFYGDVPGLDGMWIGRDVNSAGARDYFVGDIASVRVHEKTLLDAQLKNSADADPISSIALFDRNYAGSVAYRIPVLMKTDAGTLLAAADQRMGGAFDAPNDINLTIRRSTDDGVTWSAPQVLIDYPGSGADGSSVIDSAMVQDTTTGRIIVIVDHFRGGTGAPQAIAGTGFDSSGRQLLVDSLGAQYYIGASGDVFTVAGAPTTYTVDAEGDVLNGVTPAGNIYLKDGADPAQSLLEIPTSYLKLVYSDDDGLTWSDPVDLNHMVKESWMKFLGTGPGTGIQLQNGPDAGRLIIPVYYNNDQGAGGAYSTAVIYSDDGGATWERGESPNDGRVWNSVTVNSATTTDSTASLEESAVVELDDGTLMIWMRNGTATFQTRKVVVATSTDGGETWGPVAIEDEISEMGSMPSAVHYPDLGDSAERIVFGNVSNRLIGQMGNAARSNGTLRLSLDGGDSWAHSRAFQTDVYAYNSIQILDDGNIAVLWENEHYGLYFSVVPLSWLTESKI
jgi:sialidase-1